MAAECCARGQGGSGILITGSLEDVGMAQWWYRDFLLWGLNRF